MSDENPLKPSDESPSRRRVWPGHGALDDAAAPETAVMATAEEAPAPAATPSTEIVGAPSRWRRLFRPGRRALVVLGIVGVLLMLAAGAMAYVGYQYSEKYDGKI